MNTKIFNHIAKTQEYIDKLCRELRENGSTAENDPKLYSLEYASAGLEVVIQEFSDA